MPPARPHHPRRRQHPALPQSGGIFEGFTITLVDPGSRPAVRRGITRTLGPAWIMQHFGDDPRDFEIVRSAPSLTPRHAWGASYALRALPGIANAEPLFALSISDNPRWAAMAGAVGAEEALESSLAATPNLPESAPPEWSLDAISVREAWRRFFSVDQPGAGIVVGHPDTGYQDHPELSGRILARQGRDFLNGDLDAHDALAHPPGVLLPNPGHGTGTSSVIASPLGAQGTYGTKGWVSGVAPGAMIIPLRTAYSVVLVSMLSLSRAIEYAADAGSHVISISMGGLGSARLSKAVAYALKRGVIICAAAGNYVPFVVWPAAYDEVVCCAATNARGEAWAWSARGPAVDVSAPGESVWRAMVQRDGRSLVFDVGRGSGTSFATTNVAGLAALWLARHGRDTLIDRFGAEKLPTVFNRLLRDTCHPFSGWDPRALGAGLVDALALLEAPLPDPGLEGIAAVGPRLDSFPPVDRGETATFAHLFADAIPPATGDSTETTEHESFPSHEVVETTLGTLLGARGGRLRARLREVGQELAFHLATDPGAYRRFATALRWRAEPDTGTEATADTALSDLRLELTARASPALRVHLANRGEAMGSMHESIATGGSAGLRLAHRYRRMLAAGSGSLESAESGVAELSETSIKERVRSASDALVRIVRDYLGDRQDLHRLAKEVVANGTTALCAVAAGDNEALQANPEAVSSLEVIVRMDGSRPSFMIRDGDVDQATSPAGIWANELDASRDELRKAIGCVGRIDDPSSPQGYQGTGFLVADDLIVTNRHVLQEIATPLDTGWALKPNVTIDFGHEFRGQDSVNRRTLKEVVFAGKKPIASGIDHTKLDLALIRLDKVPAARRPRAVLSVDVSSDWPGPSVYVYTVGYPGSPEPGAYPPSVLERLFQSTFGYKRLAPGAVTAPVVTVAPWTVTHDSTTLGGNSGSVLLVIGRELVAAGLHYGGKRSDPRENWGHVLGRVLDQPGRDSADSLREVLERHGVMLVDRKVSDL